MLIVPFGNNKLGQIADVARQMVPQGQDVYFPIHLGDQFLMLSVQEEHGGKTTWHIRRVTRDFDPIESHHAENLLFLMGLASGILERAGVEI